MTTPYETVDMFSCQLFSFTNNENFADNTVSSNVGSGTAAPSVGSGTEAPSVGSGTEAPSVGSGTEAPSVGSGTASPSVGSGTEVPSVGGETVAPTKEATPIPQQIDVKTPSCPGNNTTCNQCKVVSNKGTVSKCMTYTTSNGKLDKEEYSCEDYPDCCNNSEECSPEVYEPRQPDSQPTVTTDVRPVLFIEEKVQNIFTNPVVFLLKLILGVLVIGLIIYVIHLFRKWQHGKRLALQQSIEPSSKYSFNSGSGVDRHTTESLQNDVMNEISESLVAQSPVETIASTPDQLIETITQVSPGNEVLSVDKIIKENPLISVNQKMFELEGGFRPVPHNNLPEKVIDHLQKGGYLF